MRSRNLAIVFTSIVGYPERIGRQTFEQTQHMLGVHERLLEPVFKQHGGRRIKVIGGTFLVSFELPTRALLCAAALQRAIKDFNARAPESERLQIRAGINLGEVRLERGDVFGDAVNVAARVEALGSAGEVLFTEALWLSMNRAGVQAIELGPRVLRGVPEPVRLFLLQGATAAPPLQAARNLVLLLSDMKGFTARTSVQTRAENARMLALHDALLLPVVRGFGGKKVKSIGDALLAAFESPTDAVLCAMAIQDRFAGFNAGAGRAEAIEVRISLSQGEVRLARGDVTGEPVQLATEAGAAADAGDVVLTDAVYLSMNKSEAPTEALGERLLPSGRGIRLRRAVRSAGATAPYGGRALGRLGQLPDPSRTLVLRQAAARGTRFLWRRAAWAAVLLVLAGAAAGERSHTRTPLDRAEELLIERQPLAALTELDKLADVPDARTPAVALVRGKAYQALGNLGLAFSDFALAVEAGSRDHGALRALADDLDDESFPRSFRPALVKLLGEKVGRSAAPEVRSLLGSARAQTRRDAMQVLELAGAVTDLDRLEVARADLAYPATPCELRKQAVQRLAMVRDPSGRQILQVAAASKMCGAREAADALRRLSRSLQAAR